MTFSVVGQRERDRGNIPLWKIQKAAIFQLIYTIINYWFTLITDMYENIKK